MRPFAPRLGTASRAQSSIELSHDDHIEEPVMSNSSTVSRRGALKRLVATALGGSALVLASCVHYRRHERREDRRDDRQDDRENPPATTP
jgi:hypothetical protein